MTFFHSIRTRLTSWYALWLAATLVVYGVTSYVVSRNALVDNLDRSLRSEIKWVNDFIEPRARRIKLKRAAVRELRELRKIASQQQAPAPDSTIAEEDEADALWGEIYQHTLLSPRRHYIQILDRNGDLLYRSQSLGIQKLEHADIPYKWVQVVTSRSPGGEELRLAVTQNDFVKIFVAYPLETVNEALDSFFFSFRLFAPLALIISVIGGWFLASKTLAPVDDLTNAAREITAENLSRRLPTARVDDELGRLTAQFNDMIGRLQSSFAQIQQFSADASHELRTPLTIMRGEIEVALRNSRIDGQTRELLVSLHDELLRLSSIVESLMSLIRSDMGRHSLQITSVPLHELLRQIRDDAQVLAEEKHISVGFEERSPVTMNGDPQRLRQLFLNLVDNAVKYTPAGGSVTVRLERENGAAVVSVLDNGVGIPPDEMPLIFNRFHRVHREGYEAPPGSGLGLSIAKWIAEAHNGTLEVESKVGSGSCFRAVLPLAAIMR